MTKLLIIGTHPCHTTGYSKAMWHMLSGLVKLDKFDITVFGIQKYFDETKETRTFPPHPRLNVYDVLKYDEEDYGYGTKSLAMFVETMKPDVVLIYNELYVSSQYIRIINNTSVSPSIVVYLDQIYLPQNQNNVSFFNNNVDHVITFSEHWAQNIRSNNMHDPISVVRHAIEPPPGISTKEARLVLSLPQDVFIFLNLNRNQIRKRLDLTIQGYVKFLKANPGANTLLIMGNVHDNTYDLESIYEYECRTHGVEPKEGLININQSRMTDDVVTKLYCACDVGINTAQGEGYGLCNYEHAWYGKPQIVSNIGGLKDYFYPRQQHTPRPSGEGPWRKEQ